MNISENIQRILTAKQNIKNALIAKGLAVDENTRIDEFPDLIGEIETGGGGMTKPEIPDSDPLTFLCITDSAEISFNSYGSPNIKDFQYKINNGNWTHYNEGDIIKINHYDKLSFWSNGTSNVSNDTSRYRYFKVKNGLVECHGNVMSLVNYKTSAGDYAFYRLFYNTYGILTPPSLPATDIRSGCYYEMFRSCYNLLVPPKLPATQVKDSCYRGMFYNCYNIITAPELPALNEIGYNTNFYAYMFYNCSSLTTAPELPIMNLTSGCYQYMFAKCTSLTTAPELFARTLANSCYDNMFNGCTNLNYVKALFTTTPSSSYTKDWLSGVSSTGTFIKSPDATWNVTGTSGVPSGWTVEIYQPEPQLEGYSIKLTYGDGTSEIVPFGEYVNVEGQDDGYVDTTLWLDFCDNPDNSEKLQETKHILFSEGVTLDEQKRECQLSFTFAGLCSNLECIEWSDGTKFDNLMTYTGYDMLPEEDKEELDAAGMSDIIEDMKNDIHKVLVRSTCTEEMGMYINGDITEFELPVYTGYEI